MTIYKTILAKGHLPKELPPSFFSEMFADYAMTRTGKQALSAYQPADKFTECVVYRLALPGTDHRLLRIPHPSTFAKLVGIVAKAFRRLLKKAGTSGFSRSRPVYTTTHHRAIRTLVNPTNLSRDRALVRAGASFLLKADISQFYPSLYTHAVGWAIDPKLRQRANWHNGRLVGKQIDQVLMDLQGKISQGIPIGNDVSFLLAEIVLGQVDKELRAHARRAFRWFDDYEIACNTREEAEAILTQLRTALGKFNLRLNPNKVAILELPLASGEEWQQAIIEASRGVHRAQSNMIKYFDAVFQLRRQHPGKPVLLYAIGLLFSIRKPDTDVLRVAESCITQALLSEPGCAQKAFVLLTFWAINGASVENKTIIHAIERMIIRHEILGASSDVSWALAYCIEHKLPLSRNAGKVLSRFHDDCIAIQSLHAHSVGLLNRGFSTRAIQSELLNASLDGEHWLAVYESVGHNFLPALGSIVQANSLFSDMLAKKVTFYRKTIPQYASIVHPGGAPEWIVKEWLKAGRPASQPSGASIAPSAPVAQSAPAASPGMPGSAVAPVAPVLPVAELIARDLQGAAHESLTFQEILKQLLGKFDVEVVEFESATDEYVG